MEESFEEDLVTWLRENRKDGRCVAHIPHICHGRHGQCPCKKFLAGVNFYRFNAKNWQFTV